MRLSRLIRWFAEIGADPDLAVLQVATLNRQVPLLYGLLLINAAAVAITHRTQAPLSLTLIVPAVLFAVTIARIVHWVRNGHRGLPTPEKAKRQLRLQSILAAPIAAAYTAWSLSLAPYGGAFEQAHVVLFVSTTVIGCIFCLVVLPQAAMLVAVSVLPAFIVFCFSKQMLTFVTIGINVTLVLGVLLRALLNGFENFRMQVKSRCLLATQHQELQRLNEENRKLAMTDSLTGLPNRRQFYSDLDAWTQQADGPSFAVGVLDLDRFKPINDTYGHQVGDRLLEAIGHRLRATAGPSVRVYRLGGDEFGLIDTQADDFVATCERLLQQVRAPIRIGEIVLSVGGSLGMAQYPDAGVHAADLFDRADYALYHAKHVHGGGVCLFTPSLETAVRADRAIEAALQASSFEEELSIVLQPIIDLSSGQLSAVEVLARWSNPSLGEISAMDFIAIAERSTAIHSITRAVFRKGLRAARQLPDDVAVSFNISACDLTSACTLAFIRDEIAATGIPPRRIWIEVTETAVMRNAEAAARALQAFRDLGVRIALDDFGTGYSSLGYVQRLPLDKIKIDRSFVRALDTNEGSTITAAVITLCHTIGLTCVAEGVETEAQRRTLADAGCEHAQGYLFSKPLPLADLLQRCADAQFSWMDRGRRSAVA
ncbi:putative bifunctional diguanylate cyclase/phosphodiesterase [Novosphingobium sp. KACC 22771]|uniref:putative bifunctional diguanylate cyclase/phosphodiesterase n=1 Tax=Novosphingobium sp. KACC 22771 TaxID=3025670 RepID=UPI0023670F0C|nr:EAL domain-containing protein [Novosphingobium sp. KACC 22771]WDF72081.1 EAL domain-containing protein [Novosphingobium sp. KACC 22771]